MAETPSPPTDFTRLHRRDRRRGGGVRLLLGVTFVLLASGCATKADIRDLGADIRVQNDQQRELIQELRQEQRALNDSVRTLKSAQADMRGTLLQRIATLQTEVELLRELTGLSQQELAAMRDQLASRPAAPGPAGGGFSGPEQTGEAAELYDESLDQFRRRSYTAARIGFDELIERYPNHALTPEARFYIGEILVEQGEPEDAIEAFRRVQEYHPSAERVPDALYRIGRLYYEAGESERAREYLERVVNTWGDAGVADLARQLLQQIG
ncbi:MAG: outer membrane protein assembly factor BamD [Gemmatimonadales bacterium]|nr:MAG: outer membrane protein assembly factor BamD [Gemmatimonadales bacterium]